MNPAGSPSHTPGPGPNTGDNLELQSLHRGVEDNAEHVGASLPPADTGKAAWLFLAGSFILEALVWGFPFSFGTFQKYYLEHGTFRDGNSLAAVGTTASGLMYLGLPFITAMLLAFPPIRRVSMVAGLFLMCTALVGSSFAVTISQLIATQGVLYAFGGVCLYGPAVLFLDQWFIRRKGLSFGIMWAGTGGAGVVIPLVLEWALDKWGHKIALRAWAATVFVLAAPSLGFIRPRLPPSRARRLDLRFLKSPAFMLFQAGNIVQSLGFFIPSVYLPSYARQLGAGNYPATLTIAVFNLASLFGRIAMGWLVDRLDVTICITLSAIVSTTGVFVFWGLSSALPLLYVFCITFGLFAGSYTSTYTGVMRMMSAQVARAEPSMVYAFLAAGRGIGNVVSGPISGELLLEDPWKGKTRSGYGSGYGTLILFTGLTALLGGLSVIGHAKRGLFS